MVFDLLRKGIKTMFVITVLAVSGAVYVNFNPEIISKLVNPSLRNDYTIRQEIIAVMQKKAEERVRIQISEALDRKLILKFLWSGKLFLYDYIEDRTADQIQGLIASENVFAGLIVPQSPLANLDKFRIGIYWDKDGTEYLLVSLQAVWANGRLDAVRENYREEKGLKVYIEYLSRYVELIASAVYEQEIKNDISKLKSVGRNLSSQEKVFLERYREISYELKLNITQRNRDLLRYVLLRFSSLRDDVVQSMRVDLSQPMGASGDKRFKPSLRDLLNVRIEQTEALLKRF